MTHRLRPLAAAVLAAGSLTGLAACGSSSSSGSGSPASAGSGPGGSAAQPAALRLTATERSCLKRRGVTLPSGGGASGGPSGQGAPPAGDMTKMRAALKACGVSLPSGPGGGRGAPPAPTATTAT